MEQGSRRARAVAGLQAWKPKEVTNWVSHRRVFDGGVFDDGFLLLSVREIEATSETTYLRGQRVH